jgi:hypothetical protein
MNTIKIKQLFGSLAKQMTESLDAEASVTRGLSDSFPTIRGGMVLPEGAAEAYIETLDAIQAIAEPEGTWSNATIDYVLWEHVEKVIHAAKDERAVAINSQGNELARRFGEPPSRWIVDLLVYGMDSSCADLTFGKLTFTSLEIGAGEESRPFLGELSEKKQMFARLETIAIDEQSAVHRASNVLDEHLAILNSLCLLGRPSLVRASRVNHADRSNGAHRVGKSAESMGSMGVHYSNLRMPLLRNQIESVLGHPIGKRISEMLAFPESEFSKRVLTGYALAGAACVDTHPERGFLMFAIALESVVLGRDTKSELTHQLATRIAHLIGNGPGGRKHVVQWVNNLYDRRSKIVHTGEYGVSRTESGLIQYYCMAALSILVLSKAFCDFTTNAQLEAWFKERMLEGPYRIEPESPQVTQL